MKTKDISTHELTIGNLVYYKIPGKPRPVPIKICSIVTNLNEEDPEYIEALDFDWIPFSTTNIKPIPLTRKRLEKNGFVSDEEETETFKGWNPDMKRVYLMNTIINRNFNIYLFEDKDGFYIEDHFLIKPIRYVHELQNILKLTKAKKLADNFKL